MARIDIAMWGTGTDKDRTDAIAAGQAIDRNLTGVGVVQQLGVWHHREAGRHILALFQGV